MYYNIKDADGNITNTIKSNLEFVEANFEHYELYVAPTLVEPTAEESEREWRDAELSRTDISATVSDYPNADAYILYREALREWPATSDFPTTRPTIGE